MRQGMPVSMRRRRADYGTDPECACPGILPRYETRGAPPMFAWPSSRRDRPICVQRLCLLHNPLDERIEVLRPHVSLTEDPLHCRPDLGLHVIPMRLCPIYLQITLDGLQQIMDQFPYTLDT